MSHTCISNFETEYKKREFLIRQQTHFNVFNTASKNQTDIVSMLISFIAVINNISTSPLYSKLKRNERRGSNRAKVSSAFIYNYSALRLVAAVFKLTIEVSDGTLRVFRTVHRASQWQVTTIYTGVSSWADRAGRRVSACLNYLRHEGDFWRRVRSWYPTIGQ